MFKRRAFVHWYRDEGMEEMEFMECEQKCCDLGMNYEIYDDNCAISSSEEEDEETETDEESPDV